MQDILDRKCPPDLSGSSESSDSDDMDAPKQVNANYQQAIDEVNDFELIKKTKYHPVSCAHLETIKNAERDRSRCARSMIYLCSSHWH